MAFELFQLLFLISAFTLSSAAAQSECDLELGSEISAGGGHRWLSSSADFAFGFRPLAPSLSNNQDLFLLAIWFDKIPEKTVVWSLEDPVPKGSRIRLTKQGWLILYDSQKKREIWTANTGSETSTCAALLNSGNFVLRKEKSKNIWQSFDDPRDTILPGQTLRVDGKLTSRHSDTNYTDGRFQLRMQRDGNLVLYSVVEPNDDAAVVPYWASGTNNPAADSELVFDETGYIYIKDHNENIFNVTKRNVLGSRLEFYHMARIDTDGVFTHYRHPRRNYDADARVCTSAWSPVQTTPEDVCTAITGSVGSGACGYNSYCESSGGRPECFCPDGYSFLDPLIKNRGCKPNFPLPSCQQNGWESDFNLVDFKELNNTNWPLADYEVHTGIEVDKETCKEICRRDCFCAAAIFNLNGSCFKKRFPLSNGRKYKDLVGLALIKVPKNNETSFCPRSKDQSTLVLVVSVLLGSSVFLNFLLLTTISVAIFLICHKKLMNFRSASTVPGIRRHTYKELEEATVGFKRQLGGGSFGTVYKGVLPSIPNRYIAVKNLDKVKEEGEKEFTTEVSAIGRTHHRNLVTLLGYCDEGNHRLLVYEYMSNGSLASLLFGLSRPHWNQRKQIAFGIARGLTYLHEECSTQIIHCDVKPQNILLDEDLVPKISDFGLAKLLLSEQSRAAKTQVRGTVGYFAPEWFRKASITVKVDVYSFGVVLLEIICCKSSVGFAMGDEEEALIDWAYDCYSKMKLNKLVENDEEARNDMKCVERLVMVAVWCIQEDPSLRPSMRRVTQMLEGVAEVSIPPRPSIFCLS